MTATITSRDGMQQALEQLARLYDGLASLRRDVEPLNPRNFATLAEGHLDEIRRLQHELDTYVGAVAADQHAASLWLRVVGPNIEWQSAPTSVLTSILDAFRKGVQSVADLILTGGLTTRPTATLKRSADSFVLRNLETHADEVLQVECQFLPELLEAAKDALDKRVQITGSCLVDEGRRARPLLVSRLEILDER